MKHKHGRHGANICESVCWNEPTAAAWMAQVGDCDSELLRYGFRRTLFKKANGLKAGFTP